MHRLSFLLQDKIGNTSDQAKEMVIRAILEWDEEAQAYSATCPELNFVSSCGDNKESAIENLKDAIQLMLEPIPEHLLAMTTPLESVELALS